MSKKSTQIAIGGVFSALCLLLMFLTGMIPFSMYVLPAMAGAMLIAVVVENGRKTAALVYITVSILSLFIVPEREAVLMFIVLLGYYPIVKELMERIRSRPVQYVLKLLLFNVTVVGGMLFSAYILGMSELLSGMNDFGRYTAVVLLVAGNVIFVVYDFLLTRYTALYIGWFKPTFLRR